MTPERMKELRALIPVALSKNGWEQGFPEHHAKALHGLKEALHDLEGAYGVIAATTEKRDYLLKHIVSMLDTMGVLKAALENITTDEDPVAMRKWAREALDKVCGPTPKEEP